jgi:hypothetical protein
MRNKISFVYGASQQVSLTKGQLFDIDIKATETLEISSMSLMFTIPDNMAKIVKAVIPGGMAGVEEGWSDIQWGNPQEPFPQIRIGWFNIQPYQIIAGEVFMTITIEIIHDIPSEYEIKFNMVDDPLVEFSGPMPLAEIYQNKTIQMDVYKNVHLTIANSKINQGYVSKPVFDTCVKCKSFSGRKCLLGNFVAAKGGKCDLFT